MVLKNKKIVLTGGAGFLGSRVLRELTKAGVPKKNIFIPRSRELDLRVSRPESEIEIEAAILLTMQTMNYLHSKKHRIAL